jgi:hypothetical protein
MGSYMCECCRKPFEQLSGVGRKKKYCSKPCADKASAENRKSEISIAHCEYCGKPLNKYQSKYGQKTCGKKCSGLSKRTLKGTTRVCVVCGDQYEPHRKDQACCSLVCSKKHSHKALVENNKKISICQMCGESFEVFFSGCIEPKYCESCRRAVDRDRCRGRRAVTSVDYVINENDVYEKYNWTCAICGEKIDPDIKWPSPQSKSIDHIIPVSKGGSHTFNNLQLAHLGCNSTKGAKECLQDLLPSLQL